MSFSFGVHSVIAMKAALWIYFLAVAVLCVGLSTGVSWFGSIWHSVYPKFHLPSGVQLLVDHHTFFYSLPVLASFLVAVRFSFGRGLDVERTLIVGACFFLLSVVVVCVTVLTLMIPILPWTMMQMDPSK